MQPKKFFFPIFPMNETFANKLLKLPPGASIASGDAWLQDNYINFRGIKISSHTIYWQCWGTTPNGVRVGDAGV